MAKPWILILLGAIVFGFLPGLIHTASALSSQDIIDLKRAGVDDQTINQIIRYQADITGLITVQEVIRLKREGVSNEVIRALASSGDNGKKTKVYGNHVDQIKEISTKDLIKLKEAGFDDELIKAVIRIQREESWPILFDLGIIKCPRSFRHNQ